MALDKHNENNTCQQRDGCQSIGIKQPQQPIFATIVNKCKCGDPRGHGSADVGAHNDGYSLLQRQNTCTDQSNRQNDGRGGTLDHSGNQCAGQHTGDHITGKFTQHTLEGFTGAVLQTVTHDFNAIEEHSQTAKHFNDCAYNLHIKTPYFYVLVFLIIIK